MPSNVDSSGHFVLRLTKEQYNVIDDALFDATVECMDCAKWHYAHKETEVAEQWEKRADRYRSFRHSLIKLFDL